MHGCVYHTRAAEGKNKARGVSVRINAKVRVRLQPRRGWGWVGVRWA